MGFCPFLSSFGSIYKVAKFQNLKKIEIKKIVSRECPIEAVNQIWSQSDNYKCVRSLSEMNVCADGHTLQFEILETP